MAVQYTASTASGYLTNVQMDYFGNNYVWSAHFSSPGNATAYVTPGMNSFMFMDIPVADPTTFVPATNSIGSLDLYFSGLVTGSTGYIMIVGN